MIKRQSVRNALLVSAGIASLYCEQVIAQTVSAPSNSADAPTSAANTLTVPAADLTDPAASSPPADAATAPSPGGVEEIVVTAERRSENLQRTPLAVTALSPQVLTQRNVQSTLDLMRVTPGLEISTASSGQGTAASTVFIRGMGQQRSTSGQSPAVGIYVDDFYYPSLNGSIFKIVDLQQVEVLRGPQGTLFGRDTIAGAIRYTSQFPDYTKVSGHVDATYGSYNQRDLSGAINVPLADNAAIRVTAGTLQTDGYVTRDNNGTKAGGTSDQLVRAQFRWSPTPTLDIDLGGQYTHSRNDGYAYTVRSINPPARGSSYRYNLANAATPSLLYNSQYVSKCDYCQPGSDLNEGATTNYYNLTSRISWHISDDVTLKSLTSYQNVGSSIVSDTDGTPLPIQGARSLIDNYTAESQEFQLSGKSLEDRLSWVGGAYFYHQKEFILLDGPQYGLIVPIDPYYVNTTALAGYVDLTFNLADKVKLIGGLRYSSDHTNVNLYDPTGALLIHSSRSFPSTTGRGGVQVQWGPKIMSYVTVSTGFRAGGFSQDSGILSTFEPETATTFEGGTRMDLFGGRLRLNPTIFYTKWNNIQIQYQTVAASGVRYFVIQNAARAHNYGAELEAEAAITEKLRLFGNLSLLRTKYDSIGSALSITTNSYFQRAPRYTYSVGARYQTEIGGGFTGRITTNWNYQAQQYSTPSDVDHLLLPAYGVLTARIEVIDPSSKWTIAVFGTNLTNKLYYVGGVDYTGFIGETKYDLGRPREIGVTLRRSF